VRKALLKPAAVALLRELLDHALQPLFFGTQAPSSCCSASREFTCSTPPSCPCPPAWPTTTPAAATKAPAATPPARPCSASS
jgi:hypothetical protein